MKTAVIHRLQDNGRQTLGEMNVYEKHKNLLTCKTLELPYRYNRKIVSCIPCGTYICKPRFSTKYREHYIVTNVPNRSYILFHAGNYNRHTKGCILVGRGFYDINKDGDLDVTSSNDAMKDLSTAIGKEPFILKIV